MWPRKRYRVRQVFLKRNCARMCINRTKTFTGSLAENAKTVVLILQKEISKIVLYLRYKECPCLRK